MGKPDFRFGNPGGSGYGIDVRPLVAPPAFSGTNSGTVTGTNVTAPYTARRLDWTYSGSTVAGFKSLGSLPVGGFTVEAAVRALSPNQGYSSMGIGLLSASDLKVCGLSSNGSYFNQIQMIQGYNTAGSATTSSESPTTAQHTDLWTRRVWLKIVYSPSGGGTLSLQVSPDGYNWDPNVVTWSTSVNAPTAIGIGGGMVGARTSPVSKHAFLLESWEVS